MDGRMTTEQQDSRTVSAKDTMLVFARMGAVMKALQLLAAEKVIQPESVAKGVRKFVKDNPAINEHLARLGRAGGAE